MVFQTTKKWLAAWMSVLLMMSGVLVAPPTGPVEAQASPQTPIYSQDGFGFSGTLSSYSEITSPVMKSYNSWPSGFSKGSFSFSGGVHDGTNIWMIPHNADRVIKVNASTGVMTGYNNWPSGFTKGNLAFSGGVYDGTNIWMIPLNADRVIKVNASTGVMTGYNSWPSGFTKGSGGFRGGVYDGTSIWMIPSNATHVIKVNASTGEMTGYNNWPSGFSQYSGFNGGVYDGTNIWMIPWSATHVIKVNASTGAMTGYDSWPSGFTKGGMSFAGGVYDGTNIWMIPDYADRVIKVNASTGAMTGYNNWPSGFTKGGGFDFAGGVYDGTNIWMMPANADRVIKVNASTGAMTGYNNWPSGFMLFSGFIGGVYDGTNIWMIPYSATAMLKISNNQAPTNIALSASSIAENSAFGTTVGTLSATDADEVDTATFTLVSGTGDTDNASFTIDGTSLKTATSFDYETKSSYSIRVCVTDSRGAMYEKQFTISVTPQITLSNGTVTNETFNSVEATFTSDGIGPDSGYLMMVYAAGSDIDNFITQFGENLLDSLVSDVAFLGKTTGLLEVSGEINNTTTTIKPTKFFYFDQQTGFFEFRDFVPGENYIILIAGYTDVNASPIASDFLFIPFTAKSPAAPSTVPPTDISLSNSTVDEAKPEGTTVGTLNATDADAGDTFTFTLVDEEEAPNTDNDSFAIDGTTLKTAQVFDFDEQSSYKIVVRVTDNGGLSYDETLAVTVEESAVKVSRDNKRIVMTFKEPIFNASDAATATAKATALRNAVKLSTNGGTSFSGLPEGATVTLKGNKLIITLRNPLTTEINQVEIAAAALKDTKGNQSEKVTSDPFLADVEGPEIGSASISKNNKNIYVVFNERVFNAATGSSAASTLSNAIKLSTNNGTSWTSLPGTAKVVIKKSRMTITLLEPLTGSTNAVQIAANAIRDMATNPNSAALEKSGLAADVAKPEIVSAIVSAANKQVTVTWNERISNAATGSKAAAAAALLGKVELSTDGGTTYNALTSASGTVSVSKNTMTIKLTTALDGTTNLIRIGADAVQDIFGNKNTVQTSDPLVEDEVKPALVSSTLSADNKKVTMVLSESVVNAATGTATAKAAALKAAVELSTNGTTFGAIDGAYSVLLKGNTLTVTFGTALSGSTNKVRLKANAVSDAVGNKNENVDSSALAADEAKPSIESMTVGFDDKTITIKLSETVKGAGAAAALKSAVQFAANGTTFAAPSSYTVTLKGDVLTVKLGTAIEGTTNKLRIAAGALVDGAGLANEELTTSAFSVDTVKPELK